MEGTYSSHFVDNHGRGFRLSERSVIEIRRQLAEGIKIKNIAKFFNISTTTVCSIKNGRSYTHVK
jgi:DNA-binding NarL/FixJ family response regulator